MLKIANSKNLSKSFLDESRNDNGFLNFVTDYQCDDLQMEFDKFESETLSILNEIENNK
ncbi:hypothetical protein F542_13900 [Bibersteinia trehalosi USDA-ARS-USMARC-188]|uniref:Uncharacterized protein n=2 Tax=Bibersteinia trehalosi TaxID=47735 RepID=A0A4V7IAS6_BIBTR|nr:hypothetical protein WQG_8150 [Bibersteinia trehalosi USDA-ARS-USMARC-192]AHG82108.1 hypothetical protein F542_13900 [Bibersteinia trehalosi USDA-ARS-USMARC-188]AHG84415.1 hypothetical protein F543_15510 [Bibersteinia trehalosi USDA-ARS-USMARC-189]